MNPSDIRSSVEALLPETEHFLCELLRFPSTSGKEHDAMVFLEQAFAGGEVQRVPLSNDLLDDPDYSDPIPGIEYDGRFNLRVARPGTGGGRSLLLNTHTDVVPPSEELADPWELERRALQAEWEPIMELPEPAGRGFRFPAVDENGGLDWGAFGTVDFDRYRGGSDKARYKAEKLREQLRDVTIMLSVLKERLPGTAKYQVLKQLRMGVLSMEQITDEDMRAIARWYLRAKKLRDAIWRLEQRSRQKVVVEV